MRFMTVREFRNRSGSVRRALRAEGEMVLTAGGRPFAILSAVTPETFETDVLAVRRARARAAVERLHADASAEGTAGLSADRIDAIIRGVRRKPAPP